MTKILATLAIALLPSVAAAQLASPGDLAKPHASLEGLSNCTKCHKAGEQLAADKCLSCHGEVGDRLRKGRGYHGRLNSQQKNACENCHKEHLGVNAKLIDWGGAIERFDHTRTGWPLRGKHAGEKCQSCHEPRRIVDSDAQVLWKRTQKTWLGVGAKCTTCHFDEHRGQMKSGCEECHGADAWKSAKFDHGNTDYPLNGKHRAVTCGKCHQSENDSASHPAFPAPRASSFLRYSPLAHRRCTDCHSDPHQGRFGASCESCHSVEGWNKIKNNAEERKFHDKTAFPLRGLHTNVACAACHGPSKGKPAKFKGLPHDKCMDCHADAHHGQLDKPACERCHTVEGFAPARFELEQHKDTRFALTGAHGAVACTSCHKVDMRAVAAAPPEPKAARGKRDKKRAAPAKSKEPVPMLSAFRFKVAGTNIAGGKLERCETCHADPHGGQFRDVADGCAKCHTVNSFTEVKLDHARDTKFALTGKHAPVACGTCHRAPAGSNVVKYKPIDTACANCHADQHIGQLGKECTRCHTTDDWRARGFSHQDGRFTQFKLDGKHTGVACAKCHPTVTVVGRKTVRYRPLPTACEACHADAHHGEFRGFAP